MKVKKVVRGTTSRHVRRYMEGNKRASGSRYVQSRTTPSRSTGSGLKNSLESKYRAEGPFDKNNIEVHLCLSKVKQKRSAAQ